MGCASPKKQGDRYSVRARGPMKIKRNYRKSSNGTSMCTTINELEVRQYVDEVFEKYDLNRDNELEEEEIRQMIKELAMAKFKDSDISEEALDHYI
jgi:hypothetical protein